jgi:hypothetical protein
MSQVTAVVLVHDPDNSLYALTEALLPDIMPVYSTFIARCSVATDDSTLNLLDEFGAHVWRETDAPVGAQYLGRVRRGALAAGLQASADHIHLCDFDRLLHWHMSYPDELRAVVEEIITHDLIVMGRTERAFATHPACQVETERLSNHVFHLAAGRTWDISSGSRGLSRQAAMWLIEHSTEEHFGVDAEWPILLMGDPAFRVAYRACEGLEFETPDRFPAEVEAAGGVDAWVAQADMSADEWARRLQYAHWAAEAAVRAIDRLPGRGGMDAGGERSK